MKTGKLSKTAFDMIDDCLTCEINRQTQLEHTLLKTMQDGTIDKAQVDGVLTVSNMRARLQMARTEFINVYHQ